MQAINPREFEKSPSNLENAVHAMDTWITSQVSRCVDFSADFIDALEYDALDRAQACVSLGGVK